MYPWMGYCSHVLEEIFVVSLADGAAVGLLCMCGGGEKILCL